MTDDLPDRLRLSVTEPISRLATERAMVLVAAALATMTQGTPEAWINYENEVARVVGETFAEPAELAPKRLPWDIHGLAFVGAAAMHAASQAIPMDPLDLELLIQRTIDGASEPVDGEA